MTQLTVRLQNWLSQLSKLLKKGINRFVPRYIFTEKEVMEAAKRHLHYSMQYYLQKDPQNIPESANIEVISMNNNNSAKLVKSSHRKVELSSTEFEPEVRVPEVNEVNSNNSKVKGDSSSVSQKPRKRKILGEVTNLINTDTNLLAQSVSSEPKTKTKYQGKVKYNKRERKACEKENISFEESLFRGVSQAALGTFAKASASPKHTPTKKRPTTYLNLTGLSYCDFSQSSSS